jgi:hypothetical protein
MLKKGYIIIALAIVSVILGSLFYNNITQAQRLRIFKDSVEITVLDWTARMVPLSSYYDPVHIEKGVLFFQGNPVNFAFVFAPKQSFLNITNLWIVLIALAPDYYTDAIRFSVTINSKVTVSTGEVQMYGESWDRAHPQQVSIQIKDYGVYQAIIEGINSITFSNPEFKHSVYGDWRNTNLEMFKIMLFIEYEYQAR